jgi:predicted MFS family arabinose efflux permease
MGILGKLFNIKNPLLTFKAWVTNLLSSLTVAVIGLPFVIAIALWRDRMPLWILVPLYFGGFVVHLFAWGFWWKLLPRVR